MGFWFWLHWPRSPKQNSMQSEIEQHSAVCLFSDVVLRQRRALGQMDKFCKVYLNMQKCFCLFFQELLQRFCRMNRNNALSLIKQICFQADGFFVNRSCSCDNIFVDNKFYLKNVNFMKALPSLEKLFLCDSAFIKSQKFLSKIF